MMETLDYEVDYEPYDEVDWRALAAQDPGADLIDLLPVGPAPVDLFDLPCDMPVAELDDDELMDEIVAEGRRIAAGNSRQLHLLAEFAHRRPSGDPAEIQTM